MIPSTTMATSRARNAVPRHQNSPAHAIIGMATEVYAAPSSAAAASMHIRSPSIQPNGPMYDYPLCGLRQ
jgi:hypothetical protein